jgi:hypothetical protein
MARSRTHRLSAQLTALGRSLTTAERARLRRWLRQAVAWQRTLRGFPPLPNAPDATPYISLYSNGLLKGCFGSHEGKPAERVGRAFLLALGDSRWGGIGSRDRESLEGSIAYVTRAEPVRADEAATKMEPGTHGVAVVRNDVATLVLPSVARDRGLDARGMLDALAKKSGAALDGVVWLVETDEIGTRDISDDEPRRAARRWLESLVDRKGAMAFAMDAHTGTRIDEGVMRYGRIAVAVQALDRIGNARRTRAWLSRELALLEDRSDMALGTLALASRAGVEVPLEVLRSAAPPSDPWHAGQVAWALGTSSSDVLWSACVRSLEARPFQPYLAMAARERRDGEVLARCVRAIVDRIRSSSPFEGGADVTPIPETALTAVSVEALARLPDREAKQAVRRARAFVSAQQVLDVPPSMHESVLGAFRASPIAPVLRCDITAHAVLALFDSRGS